MLRGRRDEPTLKYPDLGAVVAKELADGQPGARLREFLHQHRGARLGQDDARFSRGTLRRDQSSRRQKTSLPNIEKLDSITKGDHEARADLRNFLSSRFDQGRGLSAVKSHAAAYARVHGLMSCEKLFDISDEPQHPGCTGRPSLRSRRSWRVAW